MSSCSSRAFPDASSFCDPTPPVHALAGEERRLSAQTECRFFLTKARLLTTSSLAWSPSKKAFFDPFPNYKSCFKALTSCYEDAQNGTGKLRHHMGCGETTANMKTYRTTDPRAWEHHWHPAQEVRTSKSLPETCKVMCSRRYLVFMSSV